MKVLISKKTGNYYYYKTKGDFHCKEGYIKEEELNSDKSRIFTENTKREFISFEANSYDLTKKFKRGPQIITAKDLGYIVARSRINKESFIVEAGGGSGAATTFFSGIAKKVHCYEIKEEHCKIIEKNLEFTKSSNVELFCNNLADKIENEKDVDLLFLDMPNPCEVLEKDLSAVKLGRYIVCYVPSISQIQEITKLISEREDLYLEEISEVILRHWRVWERVARPEHRKEIDHTAFLVFIRKV
jgi:tRNA (adenine57-N1/adenine58-N1)-methyltransferase